MPEAPQDRPEFAAPDELSEAFAATLDRLGGFADIGAEDADGFLTAVACAPQRIDIGQWLPWLCGDAFERCFGDPADAAQARDVLQRWMERIAEALSPSGLDGQPDFLHLQPYLAEWDDAARAEEEAAGLAEDERHFLFTGALWCAGLLRGLEVVAREQHTPLNADAEQAMSAAMAHIAALLLGDRGAEYEAHMKHHWPGRTVTRHLLIDTALLAVQDLRMIWLEASLTPAPLQAGHKPGRNDPCHCGSGKKFKKCHGA